MDCEVTANCDNVLVPLLLMCLTLKEEKRDSVILETEHFLRMTVSMFRAEQESGAQCKVEMETNTK